MTRQPQPDSMCSCGARTSSPRHRMCDACYAAYRAGVDAEALKDAIQAKEDWLELPDDLKWADIYDAVFGRPE